METTEGLSPVRTSEGEWKRLRAAKSELSTRYLRARRAEGSRSLRAAPRPAPGSNVVGVGIGEQVTDGRLTGRLAIKLLVRVKYPPDQIEADQLLPEEIGGLPVDVEEVGNLRPLEALPAPPPALARPAPMPNPRRRLRPTQPGGSIGFQVPGGGFVGTFGALVRRGNELFILSNNHVLANENRLPIGTPILQPSPVDRGNPATDVIASLAEFVELRTDAANEVDAAIARLVQPDLATREILHIGAPAGVGRAADEMPVHKFGRTTGFTVGRVTSTQTDVVLPYEIGDLFFEDQILIRGARDLTFGDDGDSGALIVERGSQRAVGLLFAGSGTYVLANHLDKVLDRLNVELV